MPNHKMLVAAAFVLSFAIGTTAVAYATEPAAHAGHQANDLLPRLNAGAKWQGDANMISGMNAIRSSISPLVPAIHAQTLPADDYKRLATDIQAQVDFMVANCKLSPEADEQFHIVLAQVLDGISAMEAGPHREAGAARIVTALNSYGEYFTHPGWQPLE